eukprot:CAMPEP_0181289600 /NCGR_PEP_ID=MMETSP1101-20121128/965_1 /TAXON_ID=46948 /ORGANISM="Rhodomonas abbreviata, Strain Caron Lab Isolate" /LENGTH=271 /DNA_ID=CAMNT_0023393825 /DNA_START=20 /DNA_END=835 /DNA_ORIENTATION=-
MGTVGNLLIGKGAESVGALCSLSSISGCCLLPVLGLKTSALMQIPMVMAVFSSAACVNTQKRAKKDGFWDGGFERLSVWHQNLIWFMARMQTWPTVHFWFTLAAFRLRDYYTYVPLPGTAIPGLGQSPVLCIGGMPLPWQIHSMHSRGVRGIVNVCEEFGGYTGLYSRLGIEQCSRCPTVDYCNVSPQSIAKGVDFIHRKVQAGESVYVHCKSGVGRCAMVLVCYIARHHNMSIEEANAYVRSHRREIIHNVALRPSVQEYLASAAGEKSP